MFKDSFHILPDLHTKLALVTRVSFQQRLARLTEQMDGLMLCPQICLEKVSPALGVSSHVAARHLGKMYKCEMGASPLSHPWRQSLEDT